MEERKPVSVFKSICWFLAIFALSLIAMILICLLYGFIIGWLGSHISIVGKILSYRVIFFIFMTLTTADLGRRVFLFVSKILMKPLAKSRNVGKGFLGAGIVLMIYCIIAIVLTFMGGNVQYLDLGTGSLGFWYIGYGLISDSEE